MKVLTLFDKARGDQRPLRFQCRGPEAWQCCAAINDYLTGDVGLLEIMNIDLWSNARWHGVRRATAEAEIGVLVDITPILLAIGTDKGITL